MIGLGRASWGRVSGTIEVSFTMPFEPDLIWPALDFGFAEAVELALVVSVSLLW